MTARLVLASASASRKEILTAAKVPFEAVASSVDEDVIKAAAIGAGATPQALAQTLAQEKAREISKSYPDALVLGADQLLVCEGRIFSKAASIAEARTALKYLRGRKHQLIGALALVAGTEILWWHVEVSELWARDFSDAFLENYLAEEGEALLGSVGCYRIEAMGAQLFERISGDQFAVRGLPLFPLLAALRERGVITE